MLRSSLFALSIPALAEGVEHKDLALQLEFDALLVVGLLSLILCAVRQTRAIVAKHVPSGRGRRV